MATKEIVLVYSGTPANRTCWETVTISNATRMRTYTTR